MDTPFRLPADLIGYWWFEHELEGSPGLLIVDEAGRVIQFNTTRRRLRKHEIMRLWYTVEDPTTLRFSLRPKSSTGSIRTVQRTKSGIRFLAEEAIFPMTIARPADVPEWTEEDYREAIALMEDQRSEH